MWSVVLLLIWSQVHGSVLFGLVIYALLSIRSLKSLIYVGIIIILIDMLVPISILNFIHIPTTLNLNKLIFNPVGILSKDFRSPFVLYRFYTGVMLGISILYILLIKRISYLVPFVLTLIPALGYIRMGGFHVITCGVLLLHAEKNKDLRSPINSVMVGVLALSISYFGWIHQYNYIGSGVSPNFTSVDNKKLALNVFSQDYLTPYLTFMYDIPGFFGTFHAPHPMEVRDKYKLYLNNPDIIDTSINTCIVKDKYYAVKFFNSKIWEGSKQGRVYIFFRKPKGDSV